MVTLHCIANSMSFFSAARSSVNLHKTLDTVITIYKKTKKQRKIRLLKLLWNHFALNYWEDFCQGLAICFCHCCGQPFRDQVWLSEPLSLFCIWFKKNARNKTKVCMPDLLTWPKNLTVGLNFAGSWKNSLLKFSHWLSSFILHSERSETGLCLWPISVLWHNVEIGNKRYQWERWSV